MIVFHFLLTFWLTEKSHMTLVMISKKKRVTFTFLLILFTECNEEQF